MFWFTAVKAETSGAAEAEVRSAVDEAVLEHRQGNVDAALAVPSSYTQTGPMPAAHRCQAQFRPMVSV